MPDSGDGPIRVADGRFLAPLPVHSVRLLGALDAWRTALAKAGVRIDAESPDLVVSERRHVRSAARVGAPAILVLGASRRRLHRAGYATETVLVRPGRFGPRLFVPVHSRAAVRHALLARTPGRTAVKRLVTTVVVAALRAGIPLPGAVTLATRVDAPPHFLTAALGSDYDGEWYLVSGEGDDLQRLVWFCFGKRDDAPSRVVKCSRVRGNDAAFDREAEALRALERLDPELTRHAPALERRLQVDELPVTVETLAPGRPLHAELQAGKDRADLVDAVADWIVGVGEATMLDTGRLEPERRRLENDVLPAWLVAGAPADLVRTLPPLPAVLQHNDIGCWNVHIQADDFWVLDWESSRSAGLPLWDLLYFLTDALGERVALAERVDKHQAVPRLLRGELGASAILFERLRDAARRLHVPATAVGAIATLAWLEHARSPDTRAQIASLSDAASGDTRFPLEEVASYWLNDPLLGVAWPAYGGK